MHNWIDDLASDLGVAVDALRLELLKYRETISEQILRESPPNHTTINRWFKKDSKKQISIENHGFIMSFICNKYFGKRP